MLTAIYNGEKIYPESGHTATCPKCGMEVTPVLGTVNIHHWRHKADYGCSYGEGESEWHRIFKSLFPIEFIEVKQGNHIADVLLPNGTCIEFQNSPITEEEIISRSINYRKIIWVFNLAKQNMNGQIEEWVDEEGHYVHFIYRRSAKYFAKCMPYLVFDIGESGYLITSEEMNYSYEFNKKTGYNELRFHSIGHNMIREHEFEDYAYGIDGFKPKPDLQLTQLSLFQ